MEIVGRGLTTSQIIQLTVLTAGSVKLYINFIRLQAYQYVLMTRMRVPGGEFSSYK